MAAVMALAVIAVGCANRKMCGPAVFATSMAIGGGVGAGIAAGSDGDGGEIAGATAGGIAVGAILAPLAYWLICPKAEKPVPPPPPAPPPPAERKPIETLTGPNFDFDKSTLRPDGKVKVDRAVRMMEENADMRASIEGHTDSMGTDAYNQKLSERRAGTVRDYMVSQGVDAGRLTAKGFGESKPVESNDTDAGRAANRRVEIYAE